jgi:hypothetical protein
MEEQEKKISLPEMIIFGLLVVSAWLCGVFADISQGVLVVGQGLMVLNWVYSGIIFAAVQIWLILKGEIGFSKQVSSIVGNAAEFIPFVNMIPLNVLGFFVTVYLVNHPKMMAVAQPRMKAGGALAPAAPQKQTKEYA